jgi:hypothetical protein
MVQLLLDHNADPEVDDDRGLMPLHERDDIAAMRAILQHGVEVPWGVLHEAAQRNLVAVQLLLEHGVDVEQRYSFLNTPLHLAANAGKTDVVKFLVERWPEGKKARKWDWKTPLLVFEEGSRRKLQLSEEEKNEIRALLGGPYSEVNND